MLIRLIFIFLVFLTGCKNSSSLSNGQSIRINIAADPQTLDPRKARDLTSITLMNMFFEGLMRTSKTGDLEPALAESVEVSNDGLQYRFHLRKSFWSNGEPVTSFDFAESWRSILDPQFPSDIAYQLYGIKNAKKAKQGEISLNELGILTPDAQTLIVDLENPIPYFLQLVSMSSFFPVSHHMTDSNLNGTFDSATYICNGPFMPKAWKHSDAIEAVKNPRYWQQEQVTLAKIDLFMMSPDTEIQMFEEKNLDWAGSPLSKMPVDAIQHLKAKGELFISPFSGTYFFRVNTADASSGKKNPLGSPSFRKALALSLNREAITKNVLQGGQIPARGLVPPEMHLSEKGYFQDDVAQARSLLADALLKLDLTLDKLEPLRLSFASSERSGLIAQAAQKQWEEALGIKIELEAVEPKTCYKKIASKDYQLAVGDWTADFDDPINFLEVFKFKEASTNNTNWENSKYTDLLNQSVFCRNLVERSALLREAEEVLMDQMPIIPIFHYSLNYLKNPALEDVMLSPLGKIDFRWAHVSK